MKSSRAIIRVLLIFALTGLALAFVFDWLTRRPSLEVFFFLSCKLCGPTLNYWIVYDLLFLFGLMVAFVLVRISGPIIKRPGMARLLTASIFGALNLGLYVLGMSRSVSFFGIVIAPFLLMLVLIGALRVLTAGWDNLSACLILLTPVFVLALSAALHLLTARGDGVDTLIGMLYESVLFALTGLWLVRTGRVENMNGSLVSR